MPKHVVFDAVEVDYARVEVREDQVRLLVHYAVRASATGETLWRDRDVSHLLTAGEKQTIHSMAHRLQRALEAEELA
ncbi:MAG: hypothetical protein NZ951_01360 [Dehalococcoidia bacterium]|nr:hypothetical protein [Dehalococcoidia bacterium]MDW8119480.1 hypothetical protein [Chloroflexota bacterium]